MSPAPADVSDPSKVDHYAEAWSALMRLVRNGHSWSGSERNRLFVNDTRGGFLQASRIGGFDFPDDGRGLAVVDWDHDGDLDLWFRNRTAPRLRLMLNRTVSGNETRAPSVALRLEGTRGNRDAIGAVVELVADGQAARLVRSVRAGDLFLSQSSKWLHFGLGGFGTIREARVLWPGGKREVFQGVTAGGRFLLKEGSGRAEVWRGKTARIATALAGEPTPAADEALALADDGIARILLPARVPVPALTFLDPAARPTSLRADGKPRLLVLWSSTCPHCRVGLGDLTAAAPDLRAAGLDVLALSIDSPNGPSDDPSDAYNLIDALDFPFPWGLIDGDSLGRIHRFQSALFDRTPASTIPLAILLDGRGSALALHRGPLAVADVLREHQTLRDANPQQLHHLAPPLAGTWFTNPLAPAHIAAFMQRRLANPPPPPTP